jgi:spore coat protein CotH
MMSLRAKRHYPLVILLALVIVFLVVFYGGRRIVAYATNPTGSPPAVTQLASNVTNTIDPFDDTVVHTIQVLISDEDYQQMITTYQQTGEKDYFHADVMIDGVLVQDVGVRLKGNASLGTALGPGGLQAFGGFRRPAGQGVPQQIDPQNLPEGVAPGGFQPPAGGLAPPRGMERNPVDPEDIPGGIALGGRAVGGMGDNTQIPLLIKFDKFVDGQTYMGYTHLAVRSAGIAYDAAMLQEPITNFVFELAGLPAAQTAYASVQINDGELQLFTISENINETYLAQHFDNPNGVLYKADFGATMRYLGDDPSAYATSFSQKTRLNDADLAPLIAFLRFLSESDDATFASKLPDYLDVEAFATYLAVNNLLVNSDSMAGMGNNFYLYYDDLMGRFTVLYWDGNESLGKLNFGGGDSAANFDIYYNNLQGVGMNPGGGGRMGGANQLVTRFLADEGFKALYETRLQFVYQQAFLSGAIDQQITAYAGLVTSANQDGSLVDPGAYEQAVASVRDFIARRAAYLASAPLLSGLAASNP